MTSMHTDDDVETEWIHDWDYQRILPEHPHKDQGMDGEEEEEHDDSHQDMDMDDVEEVVMMEEFTPLPYTSVHASTSKDSTADGKGELSIFWARVPTVLEASDIEFSDNEDADADADARRNGFHMIPQQDIMMMRTEDPHELAAFSMAPPLSWECDDHSTSSISSPFPSNGHRNEGADNKDDSPRRPSSEIIIERQQQLLQEVLQRPRPAPAPCPPSLAADQQEQQQKLFKEMRNNFQERQGQHSQKALRKPKKDDPIFARQRQIFDELRKQSPNSNPASPSRVSSYSSPSSTPVPSTTTSSSIKSVLPSPPILSRSTSSPVSVKETLTRAGMDPHDYHQVVTRLTEKNLLERQRNLLQESMQRSLETRKALLMQTSQTEEYTRREQVSHVLKQVANSSRQIHNSMGTA